MADDRSKREKLEAIANAPSATKGERDNAKAILARMKPEPARARSTFVDDILGTQQRRTYTSTSGYQDNFAKWYTGGFQNQWNDQTAEERAAERRRADFEAAAKRMSADQIREAMRALAEELDRQVRSSYSTSQQIAHDKFGTHSFTVVGHSTTGAEIRRCIICGEYDRLRKKTHRPDNMEDHDWKDDTWTHTPNEPDNFTMWTQTCTGCNRKRIDPKQPPLTAHWHHEEK